MEGALYLVSMPIGNLSDITHRAVETLQAVDFIVAEDTRTTKRVLERYGVLTPFFSSVYQGAERQRIPPILEKLAEGRRLALVSDAGTPLISDPGFPLVRASLDAGHVVVPVPGACAAIAGLTASGLPTDRFYFGGALPRSREARKEVFASLAFRRETALFYESCHRILESMKLLYEASPSRRVVLARELTKLHEQFYRGTSEDVYHCLAGQARIRGEFVLLVKGNDAPPTSEEQAARRVTALLRSEGVPNKTIHQVLVDGMGIPRNEAYRWVHVEEDDRLR